MSQSPESQAHRPRSSDMGPRDSRGWDGKLRVNEQALVVNSEAFSDPEQSDHGAPAAEHIPPDEDLLDGHETDVDEIDLVHRGISSIPSLELSRFHNVEKLCLRQNLISQLEFPDTLAQKLTDLDLYDNRIAHLKGLDNIRRLTSLDLSFNKLKHIKNIGHLVDLTDLYFVQNRISRIEGLSKLIKLRNLELAANRIREIENLECLESLQELWLGKNKITELKNMANLTSLRILSIQSNRLSSLKGIDSLSTLEELYVSHNLITEIEGLGNNKRLRVLDISNNQITTLKNVSNLSKMEEFWASSNHLTSFEEIERELNDKEFLETVYFEGNPLQRDNEATYRNKIRICLPQIKQIDATYV